MIRRRRDVSDLNFTVDKPLQIEQAGELIPVSFYPPIEKLTPYQTEMIALNLINGNPRLTEDLIRDGSCDSAYSLGNEARFRVNIFSQRGKLSIVLRKLNTSIPTLEQLRLPAIFSEVCQGKNRPRPGHRRDRLRQIHHPGRAAQRDQRNQVHPHHHPGRPGGICPSPEKIHLQPA